MTMQQLAAAAARELGLSHWEQSFVTKMIANAKNRDQAQEALCRIMTVCERAVHILHSSRKDEA